MPQINTVRLELQTVVRKNASLVFTAIDGHELTNQEIAEILHHWQENDEFPDGITGETWYDEDEDGQSMTQATVQRENDVEYLDTMAICDILSEVGGLNEN